MKRSQLVLIIIGVILTLLILLYWFNGPKINYSCNVDSDCVIVDKHNCCGYYPVCANKNSKPNPDFVNFQCKLFGGLGVCGYPSVDGCECIENKCSGTLSGSPYN